MISAALFIQLMKVKQALKYQVGRRGVRGRRKKKKSERETVNELNHVRT